MTGTPSAHRTLPYVVEAGDDGDLRTWIVRHRGWLRETLTDHGAVLLRGFPVGDVDGLDRVVREISGAPLRYSERTSPRTTIKGQIYTSTEYPATEEIFLHNENSYQLTWPRLLFFYCAEPPETRGATPLADIRRVYAAIDPAVREEFARRRWMAIRNYHQGFGASWQYTFRTDDPHVVEAYCRDNGLEWSWRDGGGLRTTAVRDPVHTHPTTGTPLWFNHITMFHHTTLPVDVAEGMLALFEPDDLPTNSYFGDGDSIPTEVMDHLRDCYRKASTRFDWQRDDLLLVDNMLTAHGREPFTGARKIAVAMSEPHSP